MYQLLRDTSMAQALVRRGLLQARRFTWRQTAEATLGVYEQLKSQT
jgi:hypothetical protein